MEARADVKSRMRTGTAAALLAALPAVPSGAAAQEPSDTTRVLPIAPLEVTVLRAPVPVRDVPYAVAQLGEEALRSGKTGAFLEEALANLPGVQVQNRYNFAVGERLSVRGFGPRAQFGVRGVRVMVDGIPATMPDGQSTLDHLDLTTLGRVEVLRGPGSALYGNAAGGVLSFETRPAHRPSRQTVRVTGGGNGLLNLEGIAEGGSGAVGWIVGAGRLEYDGFRDHPDRPDDTYGEAERLNLNARVSVPLLRGTVRLVVNGLDLDAENPGSLSREAFEEGDPAFGFNVAQGTGKEIRQAQLGALWSGPAAGLRAEVGAWVISRTLENPIPPSVIDLERRAGGLRTLVRDETDLGGRSLAWGLGVEVELQRDGRENFENDGGRPGALLLDQVEEVRALGLFGQGRLAILPRLDVTAALRYDRFRFEADDRFFGPGAGGDPDDSGERTMDRLSPSVGLIARVADGVDLFANVASALETPTTTELVNRPDGAGGFNPALDPSTAVTLEGGVRGRTGRRVSWELVAFRTEVDDDLVPFEVPEQPGRSFFRNAGSATHEGWEASVTATPVDGLTGRVVWSRTDARFDDFHVEGEDFSDNRIPGLAPNRVETGLRAEGRRWFVAADVEWVDGIPVNDANTEAADAYWLTDLRAGLREIGTDRLRIEPFVGLSNLFDERYAASVAVNAFGGRFFEPGPGRTLHAGANLIWEPR